MRKSLAVVVSVAVFGTLAASAATLGGLNSASLGADQTIVASCDTDGVALSYTNEYNSATNSYDTKAVNLIGVADNCAGSDFKLTLSDGSGSLVEATGKIALVSSNQEVVLPQSVTANSVTAASLVISG